ncbi:MAG: penicillin-binding protein 2 [Elusimicrobia bacterium HGW-Elusimicrobia-1]|jgi:penicillin-binding protein 2|nr:MAG: penicillin-binding protein 2 [Elusimicrobia bacterium HGW-Elusimicrobia-1]
MWQKDPNIYYQDFIERIEAASYLFFVASAFIFASIFFFQVLRGAHYYERSERNRLYLLTARAARGDILDAYGKRMAGTMSEYGVVFYPFEQTKSDLDETIAKISSILRSPQSKIAAAVLGSIRSGRLAELAPSLSREQLFAIKEDQDSLPGISVTGISDRVYSDEQINSHLIGYIGEADTAFLEKTSHLGYRRGDIIGRAGLESLYDGYLRGDDGGWQIEVDVLGKQRRFLNYISPRKGYNIKLFIDGELQRTAYEAIAQTGRTGAAVAIEPSTGKVRLFVSVPGYRSSAAFSPFESTGKFWKDVLNDPAKPLLNRAASGLYPPGSVFKIATFVTALQKKVPPETTYFCGGKFDYGSRTFRCWKKEGHGRLDLAGALTNSCNVYFYNLGLRLGGEEILKTARAMQFGRATQVDFPHERSGSIPAKLPSHGGGESINVAIGQGAILVTPMQMAQIAAAVAVRGRVMKPIIAETASTRAGESILLNAPSKISEISLPDEVWDRLDSALASAVSDGTGRACRIDGVRVAGKTGTAQNPHGNDHAWFVCYASRAGTPASPEIALAVLVDTGGSGGAVAAPIARRILEKYFDLRPRPVAAVDYGD